MNILLAGGSLTVTFAALTAPQRHTRSLYKQPANYASSILQTCALQSLAVQPTALRTLPTCALHFVSVTNNCGLAFAKLCLALGQYSRQLREDGQNP
jgi:hypothetical protein